MQSAHDRLRSRSGQALTEYALLLALMAGAFATILVGLHNHIQNIYQSGNDVVASADCVADGGSGARADGSGGGGSCSTGAGGGGGGGATSGAGGGPGGGGGGGSSSGGGGGSSSGGGGGGGPPNGKGPK